MSVSRERADAEVGPSTPASSLSQKRSEDATPTIQAEGREFFRKRTYKAPNLCIIPNGPYSDAKISLLMADRPNETVRSVPSPEALRRAMEALPTVLRDLVGEAIVTASYGYGCHLHPDICYLPMKVGTRWIDRFIRESLEQKIVVPGKSDFSFIVPDARLEIEFCHLGDIHVSGADVALLDRFLSHPAIAAIGLAAVDANANHT